MRKDILQIHLCKLQFSVSVEGALIHSEDQPKEPLWVILATATSVKFNCQSTTWSGSISIRTSRFQASLNGILCNSTIEWIYIYIYIYNHIIFKDKYIHTYILPGIYIHVYKFLDFHFISERFFLMAHMLNPNPKAYWPSSSKALWSCRSCDCL